MNLRAELGAIFLLVGCSRPDASRAQVDPASAPHVVSQAAPAPPAPLAASDASAGKRFGAFCVSDGECGGGVCFHKRIKGADAGHERRDSGEALEHDGYCSMRCDDDADCPVPPTRGKCGARGMCKRQE